MKRWVFLLLLLLCGCSRKAVLCGEMASYETALVSTPPELRTVDICRVLERAEALETETAGAGMKWCSLAADVLDWAAAGGSGCPKAVSRETAERLRASALLLTGSRGAGILEDCGHGPLSRPWSAEAVNAFFDAFSAAHAEKYAKNARFYE